jgi:hypothetical protein
MQGSLLDGEGSVRYSVCRYGLPANMFLKAPRNSFEVLKKLVLTEEPS